MPYIIDGNNLQFAMKKAGLDLARSGLCVLLGELARRPPRGAARRETGAPADRRRAAGTHRGEAVTVVFDGPAPHGPLARQIQAPGVRILYAAPEKADEVIARLIDDDSAPRRLIVVSTDRAIRKAARRRRCVSRLSEEFLDDLLRVADRPAGFTSPAEPRQKYQGLSADQTRQWLAEFGYPPEEFDDEEDDEEDDDEDEEDDDVEPDGDWDDDDAGGGEWKPRR